MCFNMKVFTKINFRVFMNNPHKTMLLNTCDELFNGCGSYKDQNLSLWVILV